MRSLHILTVLFVAGLAAGCTSRSLTQNQCVAGDWETVGYRDGQSGQASTSLLAHQEACGKHGVIPQRGQYLLGWSEGIRSFCRADRGFAVGEQGSGYNNACPDELREDFRVAYEHGRDLYLARHEVHRLESALQRNRKRMDWIDTRVLELTAAQVDTKLTAEQRVDLFAQTKNLLDEKKRLERDIPEIEFQLDRAVAQLDRIPTAR